MNTKFESKSKTENMKTRDIQLGRIKRNKSILILVWAILYRFHVHTPHLNLFHNVFKRSRYLLLGKVLKFSAKDQPKVRLHVKLSADTSNSHLHYLLNMVFLFVISYLTYLTMPND